MASTQGASEPQSEPLMGSQSAALELEILIMHQVGPAVFSAVEYSASCYHLPSVGPTIAILFIPTHLQHAISPFSKASYLSSHALITSFPRYQIGLIKVFRVKGCLRVEGCRLVEWVFVEDEVAGALMQAQRLGTLWVIKPNAPSTASRTSFLSCPVAYRHLEDYTRVAP